MNEETMSEHVTDSCTRGVDTSSSRRPIRILEKEVAARIAAGEIVQRPASVVKELLENSIDANASEVEIVLLEGGLKTIRLRDNGSGIHVDDIPLLCEHFATSKLTKYEDLLCLKTFGFRGEALASISYVSHLTVTTLQANTTCRTGGLAYQAYFENGRLIPSEQLGAANPKKCAGMPGSTFLVEDLFYNCPLRRKSLQSANEEYRLIIDLLMKYSVRYPSISFSCRRLENRKQDFFVKAVKSQLDAIRAVYGKEVSQELLRVEVLQKNNFLSTVINANFSSKRGHYIFFVNGRLIESHSLKKAVSSIYSGLLLKGTHPFVFVDIEIEPSLVDVNIHPAKQQVRFSDEENVVGTIVHSIKETLRVNSSSRIFKTALLNDVSFCKSSEYFNLFVESNDVKREQNDPRLSDVFNGDSETRGNSFSDASSEHNTLGSPKYKKDTLPYKKVRTAVNPSGSSLNAYFDRYAATMQENTTSESIWSNDALDEDCFENNDSLLECSADDELLKSLHAEYLVNFINGKVKVFEKESHQGLKNLLKEFSLVGFVDSQHALVQYQTKLFWMNVSEMLKTMFFQQVALVMAESLSVCTRMIRCFEVISLETKVPVFRAILMYLKRQQDNIVSETFNSKELAVELCSILSRHRLILSRFFSITFEGSRLSEFHLVCIPRLFEEQCVSQRSIGEFLFRLAGETRWYHGDLFLLDVCDTVATFWTTVSVQHDDSASPSSAYCDTDEKHGSSMWLLEHILLKKMRQYLLPPKKFATNGIILEITSLEKLYRVFERC
eukprot:jgi/Galph1/976/GphlegSOOS_G5689.1